MFSSLIAAGAEFVATTTLDDDLKAVSLNLNTLRETTSALLSQIKKLEKRVHREMKDARKRRRQRFDRKHGSRDVQHVRPSV